MRKILPLITLILISCLSSCAVMKATNQPAKKDLKVLAVNTPRSHVLAELGSPVSSEIHHGQRTDIYSFVQGYSKANKTVRALSHGVADVFTLGLWEVVGTPIEGVASGTPVQIEVVYDKNNAVQKVNYIKGRPGSNQIKKK